MVANIAQVLLVFSGEENDRAQSRDIKIAWWKLEPSCSIRPLGTCYVKELCTLNEWVVKDRNTVQIMERVVQIMWRWIVLNGRNCRE